MRQTDCGLCTWRVQGDKGLTVQAWGSFCVSGVELTGSGYQRAVLPSFLVS